MKGDGNTIIYRNFPLGRKKGNCAETQKISLYLASKILGSNKRNAVLIKNKFVALAAISCSLEWNWLKLGDQMNSLASDLTPLQSDQGHTNLA